MSGFHISKKSGLVLPNSVKLSTPPSEDFANLEVFARNGFVIMKRPSEDGSRMIEKTLDIKTARVRQQKMSEFWERVKMHGKEHSHMRDRIKPIGDFLERLTKAIKIAEEQGPFQYEDMRRARLLSAPVTVSVPNLYDK